MGSMRLARSAGRNPAAQATATKATVDRIRVDGSVGDRPKSCVLTVLHRQHAQPDLLDKHRRFPE